MRLLETVAVFLNSQRGRHAAPPLQRFQGSQKVALGTLFSALFLTQSPSPDPLGCPSPFRVFTVPWAHLGDTCVTPRQAPMCMPEGNDGAHLAGG